jgi:hypothetical protein
MSKFVLLDLCLSIMDDVGESFYLNTTFFIGGFIVSGDLIHPIAYFRAEAAKLDSLVTEPNSKVASKFIDELIKDGASKKVNSSSPSLQDKKTDRDLIYLRNPKILQSEAPIQLNNAIIALRIDAIDGFVLGSMSNDV